MKYKIMTIVLTALLISACGSANKVKKSTQNELSTDMLEQGFLKGEIVFSEVENDCAYTIKTTGNAIEYLDPMNLEEEYKIDGQQVWFKYTSLRRQNRCDKARPVDIVEIQLREK